MDNEKLVTINNLHEKIERIKKELKLWDETIKKKMNLSYCTGQHDHYPGESEWLNTEMSNGLFKNIRLRIISDLELQLARAENEFIGL